MRDEPAMLRSTTGETMTLEGVDAKGRVRGLLFELDVEQRYRNPRDTNVEAVYTFPLPLDAVLLDLDIVLNGRKLVAAVVERKAAERDYEEAIGKGDTAIMLERAGDGLCTLNLGNLMAGEAATIRYRYAQLLRFEHGSVRLTVPTVIAPRYGDPRAAGLQAHQCPTNDLGVAYSFSLSIDLEGEIAAGVLASPTHALAIAATATGMHVGLARGAFLDRDFVLTVAGLEGKSLAIVARDGGKFVALASFCADVPRGAGDLPLTVKLLVDCSGSMNGDSIAAAKRALHRILASLEPHDRFSYSRFGSNVVHETKGLVAATDTGVRAAAERVGRTSADLGGTEMAGALRQVFAIGNGLPGRGAPGCTNGGGLPVSVLHDLPLRASGERAEVGGDHANAADVLILTDGEVWNADALIAEARSARQRVFVVGIGSAPAEGVLRRLAEATGGACEFVAPNEDAEGAILHMFARLRMPRIERADVTWPAVPAWTTPLPSGLFGGETIHAFAGFDAAPAGAVTLALHSNRQARPLTAASQLGATIVEDRTFARIAAARRIETASEADKLRLALDYGLLTAKTNLLVVHERAEGEKAADLPQLAHVAQMHAAGWHGIGSVHQSVACMNVVADLAPDALRGYALDSSAYAGSPEPVNRCMRPSTATSGGIDFDRLDDFARETVHRSPCLPAPIQGILGALAPVVESRLPSSLADLIALGVDRSIVSTLAGLVHDGHAEADVVRAFLEAVARWDAEKSRPAILPRHVARAMRNAFASPESHAALRAKVREHVADWGRIPLGSLDIVSEPPPPGALVR